MLKAITFFLILSIPCLSFADGAAQKKPITINTALVNKIAKLEPGTSNAHEIMQMIGEPASCLPMYAMPAEVWVCQWKGVVTSNRIENTLNVTFESGMVAKIIAVDAKGKYLKSK